MGRLWTHYRGQTTYVLAADNPPPPSILSPCSATCETPPLCLIDYLQTMEYSVLIDIPTSTVSVDLPGSEARSTGTG
jgi:hypothetical protein